MSTIYVRQADGSNRDSGASPRDAVETIHKALLLAERTPGADRIVVAPGSYVPTEVDVDNVTIVARPGAVIDGHGKYSYGFLVRGDHVTLRGFEIEGVRGAAVTIKSSHHIGVADLDIHDTEEAIFASGSDYLRILRNDITDVASHRSGTSVISILSPKAVSGYPDWDYRIQIVGNHISDSGARGTADGFAVILDNPQARTYAPGVLVAGNLLEHNAKGILFFNSENFCSRNNLLIDNGYAGIASRGSSGHVEGNVVVADIPEAFTFRSRMLTDRIDYDDNTVWHTRTHDAGMPPQIPLAPEDNWHVYAPDVEALRHAWIMEH